MNNLTKKIKELSYSDLIKELHIYRKLCNFCPVKKRDIKIFEALTLELEERGEK